MKDSIHNQLRRVRKPRVHLTYEVETNGHEVQKELPFVAGVLGDYSGDNTDNQKPLKERKFVQIDRHNFNEVMENIDPSLFLKVDNTLADDGSKMEVNLNFNSIDDFGPDAIVEQVAPLRELLNARNKLRDLLSKADRSDDLENVLEDILKNTNHITEISQQLNSAKNTETEGED